MAQRAKVQVADEGGLSSQVVPIGDYGQWAIDGRESSRDHVTTFSEWHNLPLPLFAMSVSSHQGQ